MILCLGVVEAIMLVFNIVAGVASIAGAFLSWQAWRASISARDAAREAKRAVRIANASEALRELNQSALELLDFIQNDRWQAASVRARDLFTQIGAAQMRWQRFLDDNALETAQGKVRQISIGLTDANELESEVKQKMVTYCHAIVKVLTGKSNRILAGIEQLEEER